ncbi:metallophosphoesterase family protein [Carboxylicivirga sp. N1Y90]|uniref:metallophosphoesterase family protein n=1 Tax=Carboxylicivirga fragile TaxID=3417571 RepID=UPI003D331D40|nr:metallophosphoesterase [Marinilabiliaceae bacterium N1Y90]
MRYAILTDIHEDIVHLKRALKKIEKLNCDEIICLGDISGFSVPHYHYFDTRDAHECLRLVRENCSIIIAGNHDLHAAQRTPSVKSSFNFPDNWYDMDYHARAEKAQGKIWLYDHDELDPLYTKNDVAFLKSLPEYHIIKTKEINIFLSHFIYPNLSGSMKIFLTEIDEFGQHKQFMKDHDCEIAFAGHFHFSGLYVANDHSIIGKRFNKKYNAQKNDCILVPPIAGSRLGKGFCIYDTETNIVQTKRI